MSDATSGFKSAREQFERQSQDYERITYLRMGRRPELEPVGAGIARDATVHCSVLFWADGLKRSPRAPALRSGPSAVAFGRRVCRDTTSMRYAQAIQHQESSRLECPRNSRGTTGKTDEEERGEKSVPHNTRGPEIVPNRQMGRRYRTSGLDAVRLSAFITTTYWYHSVTIPSPFPTGNGEGGTSVVPLLSSRGVGS